MEGPRVLLDINVLVSGMFFTKGNEHEILRLVEEGKLRLVMPETVLMETKKVLAEKFAGFDKLLDLFLERIHPELIPLSDVMPLLETHTNKVEDSNGTPIYSGIVLAKPDFVVTGDKLLRLDLRRSRELTSNTKVCSSKEFLQELGRIIGRIYQKSCNTSSETRSVGDLVHTRCNIRLCGNKSRVDVTGSSY